MSGRADTKSQVRALLWEEGRVGGAIVLVSFSVAVLLLFLTRFYFGDRAWIRDEMLVHFAALGIPLLTAIMVILNPDYSGHLTGGFSKRILRYPVETRIAVAVSLLARTLMIFIMSTLLMGLASMLFQGTPGLIVVCSITFFYLVAQLLDWLRGPMRGLSSLIVLALTATVIGYFIWPGMPEFNPIGWAISLAQQIPFVLPFVIPMVFAAVYAFAAPLVHLDRIGRRYGIPEIWEWPRAISIPGGSYSRPFRSPMAAQVWFELHRAKWVLPIATALIFSVYLTSVWIRVVNNSYNLDDDEAVSAVLSMGVFVAVVLAAAAHGVQTRVIGFRRKARMSGYEYMQPLTDAQFASARLIAGALLLVPTLIVVFMLHFGIPGRFFISWLLPEAIRLEMLSPREVVWLFTCRVLLVGLLAWTMFAIGTRYFRYVIGFGLIFLVWTLVLYAMGDDEVAGNVVLATTHVAVAAFIGATLWAAFAHRRSGAVSSRTLGFWLLAWALLAWLFNYAFASAWPAFPLRNRELIFATITSLGVSALFPLVYFAILADLRRRRLEIPVKQDLAQHRRPLRIPNAVALAIVTVFIVWLGWPAPATFIQYRQQAGYPWPHWPWRVNFGLTPEYSPEIPSPPGIDEVYPEPPAGTNVAPAYTKTAREARKLERDYYANLERRLKRTPEWFDYAKKYLLVVGSAPMETSGSISYKQWQATDQYWSEVTSKVAPTVKEIGARDTRNSRYPVALDNDRYRLVSNEMNSVWVLSRQLQLDALHWTVSGHPVEAAESILAMIPLAESLNKAPLEEYQGIRVRIARVAAESVQTLLNRSVPDDAVLQILEQGLMRAFPDAETVEELKAGIMWETVQYLRLVSYEFGGSGRGPQTNAFALFQQLVFPSVAQEVVISLQERELLTMLGQPWPVVATSNNSYSEQDYYYGTAFMSPGVQWYGRGNRNYTAENLTMTRTMVNMARATLAVERFRLANGHLPVALADLVPAFLNEVPDDLFAGNGIPLRYLVRDSGEYIVYSVGEDMYDNKGERVDFPHKTQGDIIFTVAPMSVRTGPQVAEEIAKEEE